MRWTLHAWPSWLRAARAGLASAGLVAAERGFGDVAAERGPVAATCTLGCPLTV